MKKDEHTLRLMLHILSLTGEYLQKSRFKNKKLGTTTQQFKLKLLNSKSFEPSEALIVFITDVVSCDLDDLLLLKVLYSINFKDSLDQQSIKRTIPNMLLCTYSNLRISKEDYNAANKSYLLTLIIQNIYQHYQFKYYLEEHVEKNYYDP
jgi:hypothetical protein